MPTTINPLRYPGAKRQLIPYVAKLLECNNLVGCKFYEPYAGSAVVGLDLLNREIVKKLVLVEKDLLIYSFWKCVFCYPDKLCARIENTPISIDTWRALSPFRKVDLLCNMEILDLGFAGLFFNRTNFSGIIKANPIGGIQQSSAYKIDCRFNKPVLIDLIQKISQARDHIEVYWDDALNFMNNNKKKFIRETSFVYFDPPYYSKGKQMYRHYYTDSDHKSLAGFVKKNKHFNWLISYDDAPFICGLYGGLGAQYRPFHLDYSAARETRSRGKELLISNLPLPPVKIPKASGSFQEL
ncbi:DNA adenine methylase [Desulfoscipio gibsoniae]